MDALPGHYHHTYPYVVLGTYDNNYAKLCTKLGGVNIHDSSLILRDSPLASTQGILHNTLNVMYADLSLFLHCSVIKS